MYKDRSRAGAVDLAGSGMRGKEVCRKESREVALRGTGSDGGHLAPVLGKIQAGKCCHMSRGGACKSVTVLQPLPSRNEGEK